MVAFAQKVSNEKEKSKNKFLKCVAVTQKMLADAFSVREDNDPLFGVLIERKLIFIPLV